MRRPVLFAGGIVPLAVLLLVPSAGSQPAAVIRGFTPKSSATERQVEARYQAVPKAEHLREHDEFISGTPHHAGSPMSRKVAEYILEQFKSYGLNAQIEEFQALMPYPTERVLELVSPGHYTAQLKEPVVPEDKDSGDADQLPTFNAYSADGDVTADLVYVNYGIPEDYDQLAKLGIDVKGKIVIARYGKSWRGIKPKVAYEHGAVGCIIYSDPMDDGYYQGDVYPKGAYRPEQGVQRGSVMDMPVYPGDPLTPGVANVPGGPAPQYTKDTAPTILKIPVLPISYGDALPLLKALGGPVAPKEWRGALPITYHVGSGPSKVHLKVAFDWKVRPLYDVIVRIDGTDFPDQWVIYGNHHDAWVNGASDPTSGQVVLMETARGLGELVKSGWKPKRTILLCAWDGEEWGLLGSTEWSEKHAAELQKNAVVYINGDSNGKGWLNVGGSHSLQAFANDLMHDIQDPKRDKSLYDAKLDHAISEAKTDADKQKIRTRKEFPIEALGSGSDYTSFLDYLQIASLSMEFGGDGGGGVYHSIYDSYYWYTHFSDTDFEYGAALSKTIGTAMLRLADADVLPFDFRDEARTLKEYVDEIEKLRGETKGAPVVDMGALRASIDKLDRAASAYDERLARAGASAAGAHAAELNQTLYTTERAFRYEKGLPRREWFKHLIYAPGFYTGYGVKTLPGIREAIEQKNWTEAKEFVPIVAGAINKLTSDVDHATSLIGK